MPNRNETWRFGCEWVCKPAWVANFVQTKIQYTSVSSSAVVVPMQGANQCIRNHPLNTSIHICRLNDENDTWDLVQTFCIQTNFRPVQTFCTPEVWDPYFCKMEESCKPVRAYPFKWSPSRASQIPLASFEGWDFGPKIGLDGLHGLAQVWTPLPLEVVYDKLLVRPTSEAETLCCWRGMTR